MSHHESEDHAHTPADDQWSIDNPLALCEGCPECDVAAGEFIVHVELDLRALSLDLWVAGWTPNDLIAEVRRTSRSIGSASLVAQLLIVDDSHRSEQARPESWRREIEVLRDRTGIDDVATGWLGRWIKSHDDAQPAADSLQATVQALGDLVDPRAVA